MNAGGTFNDGVFITAGLFIMNGGVVNIASGQTITLTKSAPLPTRTPRTRPPTPRGLARPRLGNDDLQR